MSNPPSPRRTTPRVASSAPVPARATTASAISQGWAAAPVVLARRSGSPGRVVIATDQTRVAA
jgi:hypothetical protein